MSTRKVHSIDGKMKTESNSHGCCNVRLVSEHEEEEDHEVGSSVGLDGPEFGPVWGQLTLFCFFFDLVFCFSGFLYFFIFFVLKVQITSNLFLKFF